MRKIDWIDLAFVILIMSLCVALIMFAISAYRDTQSRMEWRESTSLEMIQKVKREAVNEYISKQMDYETIFE